MKTENLERYLNSFASNVVMKAQGILNANKGNTALGQSIRAQVIPDGDGYSTQFYMADYGTFVDEGVSGNKKQRKFTNWKQEQIVSSYKYKNKQPPPGILAKWIKKKGIKGRDKKTGRFISNMSLAFIMGRKIKSQGIQGISFFSQPLGLEYKKLTEELLPAFVEDITTYLVTFTKHK